MSQTEILDLFVLFRTNHSSTRWEQTGLFKWISCKNSVVTWSEYWKCIFCAWSFTSSGGNKTELLAQISGENGDVIDTKLYEVDVIKPATLVLKNVNESYDGTYVFTAITAKTGISQVTVFIAGKFQYSVKNYTS